ncbi:MAG: hypothetical protein IPM42_05730 [Saprospiraceae bacterium]|nr:hypothetical protein [Saprospiraceae bacterium]
MVNFIKRILFIAVVLFLFSCTRSMSPIEVNRTLPTLTQSKSISRAEAEEAVKTNKCRYLVKDRNYVAPIGLSLKSDLRNGAQGIDEWVKLDGGNTYVLKNYNWVTVNDGATQLYVDFDTLVCE